MRLEYNIIPDPQLSSPTALFPVESAETETKRPFTARTIAEVFVPRLVNLIKIYNLIPKLDDSGKRGYLREN